MKNYIGNSALAVNETEIDGRCANSVDLITDWGKTTAVINVSVLKKMLAHIPRIGFTDMKQDLIDDIRLCGTKEEIETVVTNTLDFGSLMKAIGEVNDDIKDGDETGCELESKSFGNSDLRI
tara:strand:- start:1128 stop:1493 length:366 start_codon:yes stop_codon:yes gene_type:complete